MVNIDPDSLAPGQVATLKGLFDEVPATEEEGVPEPTFLSSTSILWERDRKDCFREISRATLQRKVVISTVFPEKLQEDYDLYDAAFLWITPTPHPNFSSYDVSRLDLEVLRDASRSIATDTLIYLGELELLVEGAGFLTVLEFVKHIGDLAISRSALVVASMRGGALPRNQQSTMEKRFAVVVG